MDGTMVSGGKEKIGRRHRGGLQYDAYLVGLDCGYLLVGRNGVADLLLPRLERAFRNGFGHLWHFNSIIWSKGSTPNMMSVHNKPRPATSNRTKREVQTPHAPLNSFVEWSDARCVRSLERGCGVRQVGLNVM